MLAVLYQVQVLCCAMHQQLVDWIARVGDIWVLTIWMLELLRAAIWLLNVWAPCYITGMLLKLICILLEL